MTNWNSEEVTPLGVSGENVGGYYIPENIYVSVPRGTFFGRFCIYISSHIMKFGRFIYALGLKRESFNTKESLFKVVREQDVRKTGKR